MIATTAQVSEGGGGTVGDRLWVGTNLLTFVIS